jgi:hypothetical protein
MWMRLTYQAMPSLPGIPVTQFMNKRRAVQKPVDNRLIRACISGNVPGFDPVTAADKRIHPYLCFIHHMINP